MYLNLLYNGKKYLYETNNQLNIGHLKELSEKILNSDKNLMHIIYNNNKYIFPNDKTFLKDLIPKGQKRTAFSIKVDEREDKENIDEENGINTKTPKTIRKSFDEVIKSNSIKKNIFKNFSNIWNNQKKFNNILTYKFNEFLIEVREFNRRVNEVYDELFQSYTQSNMNYNHNYFDNNENNVNNKLTEISHYEYQMIKFIEREKFYYKTLNSMIRKCLQIQNSKTIISNKNLEELYNEMFDENSRNHNFDYKKEETEISHNFNNNNQFNSHFENKNSMMDNTYSTLGKTRNRSLFGNSSFEKITKKNKNKILPLLSYDSNNGKNEIINSKGKNMIISTELGTDGVQRGKIVLFSNEDNKSKSSLFGLKKEKEINKNKKDDNKMVEEENGRETEKKNHEKENEDNNPKLNIFKNRLIFRNKKSKDYLIHFKTKEEGMKNKSIIRNLSSEETFNEKNKLKNIKLKKQKSIIQVNSNLDIITSSKNIFNKKNSKSNRNLSKIEYNKKNNYINKEEINSGKKNNISKHDNHNISKLNNETKKNKSSKSIKEIKNKNENKDIEYNKVINGNENINLKTHFSDSSDVANNNNSSNNNSKKASRNNSKKNIIDKNFSKEKSINKEENSEKKEEQKDEKKEEKQKEKEKNENNNKIIDNNTTSLKDDSKNKEKDKKNDKKDKVKELDKKDRYKLVSYQRNSIQSLFSKDPNKKSNKKKKKKDEEDSPDKKDEEKNSEDNEDNNKKKSKEKLRNDIINEENKESDESKKEENKDPFEDLNLLRSLLNDKNDPYKRKGYSNNKRENKIFKDDGLVKPGMKPESDDEDEEKKMIQLRKKKKLIKNKYDFLI